MYTLEKPLNFFFVKLISKNFLKDERKKTQKIMIHTKIYLRNFRKKKQQIKKKTKFAKQQINKKKEIVKVFFLRV